MTLARIAAAIVAGASLLATTLSWLGPDGAMVGSAAALLPLAAVVGTPAILALGFRASRRAVVRAASVIIAMLLWWPMLASLRGQTPTVAAPPGAARFRVVEANLYHGNLSPRAAAQALERSGADALLLVEAGGGARDALALLGAAYPFQTRCRLGCDVAILSRRPFLPRDRDNPFKRRRSDGFSALTVRVVGPDGAPARLVVTHFPRPSRGQAGFRAALAGAVAETGDPWLILGGDMNTVSWSGAMRRQDRALFPLRRLDGATPTYPARLVLAGHALRWPTLLPIDHAYAGPGWKLIRLDRFAVPGSDHEGLVFDLWRTPRPIERVTAMPKEVRDFSLAGDRHLGGARPWAISRVSTQRAMFSGRRCRSGHRGE